MAKNKEVPLPALIAIGVLVLGLVGYLIYSNFLEPAPVINTDEISPERLQDPDVGPTTFTPGEN